MKRSEMISVINNVMADGDFGLISNYWPEQILTAIENAGMNPPINGTRYCPFTEEVVPNYNWEPESE